MIVTNVLGFGVAQGAQANQPEPPGPAVPFRGMVTIFDWFWFGEQQGKYDPPLSDRQGWDERLKLWSSEGFNAVTYYTPGELSYGDQRFLRLLAYPEAQELAPERVEQNMAELKWVLRRAKELGMDNYLYTWIICWTEAFGRAHGLNKPMATSETVSWYHNATGPPYGDGHRQGIRNELTNAYTQAVFEEMTKTYEDLDGYYLPIGEAVPGNRGTYYREVLAPAFVRGGQRPTGKPLVMAHNWMVPLETYVKHVAAGAYERTWLGYHAWNEEQICDRHPHPTLVKWAETTGLPTVVSVYNPNVVSFPFNSPRFAYGIVTELKKIPNIRGYFYWEFAGRKLCPLFRKSLAYYASNSEPYSVAKWAGLLEEQFGCKVAAGHLLKAYDISGRIIPEMYALMYTASDQVPKELQLPYKYFLGSGASTTAPMRTEPLMTITAYVSVRMAGTAPAPDDVTTPTGHMLKVRRMGEACLADAEAALSTVTRNKQEAQRAVTWMKAYKLLSAYYERKIAAGTAALLGKATGKESDQAAALALGKEAYESYVRLADFMLDECEPIMSAMYKGAKIRTMAVGWVGLKDLKQRELEDLEKMAVIFGWRGERND